MLKVTVNRIVNKYKFIYLQYDFFNIISFRIIDNRNLIYHILKLYLEL